MSRVEAALEEIFRERVKTRGGMSIKLAPIQAGIPDRLVIFPVGRLFLVELKTDTGDLEPIQKLWHARINKLGVVVHVVVGEAGIENWVVAASRADYLGSNSPE